MISEYEKIDNWKRAMRKFSHELAKEERSASLWIMKDEIVLKELDDKRNDQFTKTQRALNRFKSGLEDIHDALRGIGNVKTDNIQSMLERYENRLLVFKKSMREDYEKLVCEEKIVLKDIKMLSDQFDTYDSEERISERRAIVTLEEEKNRKRVEETRAKDLERQAKIGAVEKQLTALGGRNCTWESRDHSLFLKIWTQSFNIQQYGNANQYNPTTAESHEEGQGGSTAFNIPVEKRRKFVQKLAPMFPGVFL